MTKMISTPMQEVVQLGSVGIIFEVEFVDESGSAIDVSSATTKEILALFSDGSTKSFTATFSNSGTDGKIRYVTASADDLDVAGILVIQGHVVGTSFDYYGMPSTLVVNKNIVIA